MTIDASTGCIGELRLGNFSETVVVVGNAPHDRPRTAPRLQGDMDPTGCDASMSKSDVPGSGCDASMSGIGCFGLSLARRRCFFLSSQ